MGRPLAGNLAHQVNHPLRKAPFVVVPTDDLDHITSRLGADYGAQGVKDRAVRVAYDIAGDDRIATILKDALELALGGFPDGCVDLVYGNILLQQSNQVNNRVNAREATVPFFVRRPQRAARSRPHWPV